jgi:hypothetical protein
MQRPCLTAQQRPTAAASTSNPTAHTLQHLPRHRGTSTHHPPQVTSSPIEQHPRGQTMQATAEAAPAVAAACPCRCPPQHMSALSMSQSQMWTWKLWRLQRRRQHMAGRRWMLGSSQVSCWPGCCSWWPVGCMAAATRMQAACVAAAASQHDAEALCLMASYVAHDHVLVHYYAVSQWLAPCAGLEPLGGPLAVHTAAAAAAAPEVGDLLGEVDETSEPLAAGAVKPAALHASGVAAAHAPPPGSPMSLLAGGELPVIGRCTPQPG